MMMKVFAVMVACMVISAPYANALNCGQVVSFLIPCFAYLQNGGKPTVACCSGVQSLNNAAKSTPDRKTACTCLKGAYGSYGSMIKPSNAAGLPGACSVNIPYKISPSTDCSKIQ
ncbi:non-specific lipid-transfer protein-like [Bidens hawaiensis]|uniref:non-specific lipid-transfer protein-like n=1 Tax=Bidens hawaiensis TaxID=980011 RepID=UPI00404AD707